MDVFVFAFGDFLGGDPFLEALDEFGHVHAGCVGFFDELFEDVQVVGEFAFGFFEEDFASDDAASVEDVGKESFEVSGLCDFVPVDEAVDEGVGFGEVAASTEFVEIESEECGSPGAQSVFFDMRFVDGAQEIEDFVGFGGLVEAFEFVEREGDAEGAQELADVSFFVARARQNEDVLGLDGARVSLAVIDLPFFVEDLFDLVGDKFSVHFAHTGGPEAVALDVDELNGDER